MLRHKGPRRQVFHGGSRSTQVIKVAANVKVSKAKRLERAQLGYQLKHLRATAFKQLPKKLQTPELRKAMYDLTIFDNAQAVGFPTLIGYNMDRNNNAVSVRYHDDSNSIVKQKPDITFDDAALQKIMPFIKDEKLKNLLVTYQQRYQQLCTEIRQEQFPKPALFSRPVNSRQSIDLIEINEQFKENNTTSDSEIAQRAKSLSPENQKHMAQIDAIYTKLASPDITPEESAALVEKLTSLPVLDCEYQFLKLPEGIKPTKALTARVYQILAHPIDYLDLYKAVFRGKQSRMSQKLMRELDIMRYAAKHFTDEEFQNVNAHRAAVMTWKLMNSEDVDNESVAACLNYNDRLLDRQDRAQIHHNPEIMADSWIVEAFNNRNNPQYAVEIIKGAKAADADLNRFKLFLNDTELVPRRLNVFLGLHYIQHKRTLPADGMESFFRALNHSRYPGQVNTLLNIAVTSTPGLVVPPKAIYEAIIAAHKIDAHETVAHLSNYIRHTTGIGWDKALPMDYRSGSIYIDSLQIRNKSELKTLDFDLNSETTATLKDMIARGAVPHVFATDIVDAFLIPEEDAVDPFRLLGGNADPRTMTSVTRNKNHKQLKARQAAQDKDIHDKLKTFNINLQHHILPNVAYTALNYSLRTLQNFANEEGLTFRKPVRIYISNMQTLLEDFNSHVAATDRNNSAGSIQQINTDLNGDKIYKDGEVFGVDDLAVLPRDKAQNTLTLPAPTDDINQDYINLTKALDTADMFDKMQDEKAAPISPHVAHLVEQCIPTIAYNPHIYEDVLDIIYIKTGLYGEKDTGLRNPNKIDEYLAKKIKSFLYAYGIKNPIVNNRFGYFEISPKDMNDFLSSDLDALAADFTVAEEKFLQREEELRELRPTIRAEMALKGLGAAMSDDEVGVSIENSDIPHHLKPYAYNVQYNDMKHNHPIGRKSLTPAEVAERDVFRGEDMPASMARMEEFFALDKRINIPSIDFPDSLKNHVPRM